VLELTLEPLINWVTQTIGDHGILTIFILMLLESTGVLISSEAIQPFAGFLVFRVEIILLAAVAAGAVYLFFRWRSGWRERA